MMAGSLLKSILFAGLIAGFVSGCEPGTNGTGVSTEPLADGETDAAVAPATSVKLVDHDVEAPNDFQASDKALWDGRPSLGGVWVAAEGVTDPMRVIMRNPANGKFVIGALFRREAENPGPRLQISSDAADALGVVAGEPATINVTALRREEVAAPTPDASKPLLDTSETLLATPTDDATAAIGNETAPPAKPVVTAANAPPAKPAVLAPAVAAEPVATGGVQIQIGIFSVEDNARRAVTNLAKAGVTATVRKETSLGKPLWSVTASGDAAMLAKIKAAGFTDAYFLKR